MTKRVMKRVSLLAGAVLLALASSASAELGPAMTVEAVMVYENGCVLIKVPNGSFNANGYLVIDSTTPARKEMLSVATAALLSGKKVQINREVRAAGCWGIVDYAIEIRLLN